MSYSFDGIGRVITIASQTVVSVRDIYSRWADWVSTSDNAKFLPAFDPVGGQSIDATAGTAIPIYAFLLNGWKIRPQEASHTLTVNDGVLLVDGGGDPFVNPIGNFVVRVNYQQPVQAITVSTGGGSGVTPSQIWQHVVEAGMSAEEMMRILVSFAAGNGAGLDGSASTRFKSLDGTKDRIVATVTNSERTVTARDAT